MNRSRRTRDRRPTAGQLPRRLLLLSSDERLVQLVQDGDAIAFELLYERHVVDALWFAREALGSREQAEEAVRHSFAAAHAYLARGDGRDVAFAPWLHTILANHCLSMLQERRDTAVTTRAGQADEATGELATVVDLDEWRQRRKLLGIGLPIAPSPGFQESVMAACGVGAGATTVGTSLLGGSVLGGTLAKVAAVVVLAGGAGVAGDVATNRGAPADAEVRAATPAEIADAGEHRAGGPASARRRDGTAEPPRRGAPQPAIPPADAPASSAPGSETTAGLPLDAHGVPSPGLPVAPQPPIDAAEPPADSEPPVLPELDEERLELELPVVTEAPQLELPIVDEPPQLELPLVELPGDEPPEVVDPAEGVDDGTVLPGSPSDSAPEGKSEKARAK